MNSETTRVRTPWIERALVLLLAAAAGALLVFSLLAALVEGAFEGDPEIRVSALVAFVELVVLAVATALLVRASPSTLRLAVAAAFLLVMLGLAALVLVARDLGGDPRALVRIVGLLAPGPAVLAGAMLFRRSSSQGTEGPLPRGRRGRSLLNDRGDRT